jgi:hypothetical protein
MCPLDCAPLERAWLLRSSTINIVLLPEHLRFHHHLAHQCPTCFSLSWTGSVNVQYTISIIACAANLDDKLKHVRHWRGRICGIEVVKLLSSCNSFEGFVTG